MASEKNFANPLRRNLQRLLRSMDYVSRHPVLRRDGAAARQMVEVYQHLGLAWEFLALQCRHDGGWRRVGEGKLACKICGSIRGMKEHWLLLPRTGPKIVGRQSRPTSKRTFASRKAATVVNDSINFHGVKLNVEVLNPHRSRLFRRLDITVAPDRLVKLQEGAVECSLSTHRVDLRLEPRKPKERPPYSAFASELPRKMLKRFPIMVNYDQRGRFVGLTILKSL